MKENKNDTLFIIILCLVWVFAGSKLNDSLHKTAQRLHFKESEKIETKAKAEEPKSEKKEAEENAEGESLKEIEAELRSLKCHDKNLVKLVEAVKKGKNRLIDEKTRLKREMEEMKEEIEEQNRQPRITGEYPSYELIGLRNEYLKLFTQKNTLNNKLPEYEADYHRLEKRREETLARIIKLKEEKEKLKKEAKEEISGESLKEMEAELAALNKRHGEISSELESVEEEQLRISGEQIRLEKEMKEIEEEIDKLSEEEIDKLRAVGKDNDELTRLNKKYSDLLSKLNALDKRHFELSFGDGVELHRKRDKVVERIMKLRKDIEKAKQTKQGKQGK